MNYESALIRPLAVESADIDDEEDDVPMGGPIAAWEQVWTLRFRSKRDLLESVNATLVSGGQCLVRKKWPSH